MVTAKNLQMVSSMIGEASSLLKNRQKNANVQLSCAWTGNYKFLVFRVPNVQKSGGNYGKFILQA